MTEASRVHRGDLERLLGRIVKAGALDLSNYRRAYVERRVTARMRTLGFDTYRQYSAYLERHPEEPGCLLETLTINVTDFFRDRAVYDLFRKRIVPDIISQKRNASQKLIRVWSAGCATGEEPYSIAMSFLDSLGGKPDGLKVSVIATDIDPEALRVARRAEYDIVKLRQLPASDRERYAEVRDGTFRLKSNVTNLVKFRPLNLFEDRPIQHVDLIFCRNVFIYFMREQQEMVLERFWSALHRGGYVVLGRSEKMPASLASRFELIDGRHRVYRKPLLP